MKIEIVLGNGGTGRKTEANAASTNEAGDGADTEQL